MTYSQLNIGQRYEISALRKKGCCLVEIAERVGVSHSTVSRELRRNQTGTVYEPEKAQKMSRKRRARPAKFTQADWAPIEAKLRLDWSPDQTLGYLRNAGHENLPSIETIYQHIYTDFQSGGTLWKCLRNKRKLRRKRLKTKDKRGSIPNRVGIDQRPPEVETKAVIGHWEGDTVVGAGHQQAIVTLVERHSKYLVAQKVVQATAGAVAQTVVELLQIHAEKVETITFDNGREFCSHAAISQELAADIYFARPYHSWERGLNEHTNGLLRQYFPKKTPFAPISQEQIQAAVLKINQRPRKILGYRTPEEVFFSLKGNPF